MMQLTIQNDFLRVTINKKGAELRSIQTLDQKEYLWQADPAIWGASAPNLFPYIARLTEETYIYKGKKYHLPIHGFFNQTELEGKTEGAERAVFSCESSEETRKCYPFEFRYAISYTLKENVIEIESRVENKDEKRMYFGIGGHPGFCLPLEEHLSFEDYYLEFEEDSHPDRVIFTPDCFLAGREEAYELEKGKRISLHHDLFDEDAIVLRHVSHGVLLGSEKGKRGVKVNFPDAAVVGFWHMPKTQAGYVCIEPWSSLPSRNGVIEDISQQSDLVALDAGESYTFRWSIEIRK